MQDGSAAQAGDESLTGRQDAQAGPWRRIVGYQRVNLGLGNRRVQVRRCGIRRR